MRGRCALRRAGSRSRSRCRSRRRTSGPGPRRPRSIRSWENASRRREESAPSQPGPCRRCPTANATASRSVADVSAPRAAARPRRATSRPRPAGQAEVRPAAVSGHPGRAEPKPEPKCGCRSALPDRDKRRAYEAVSVSRGCYGARSANLRGLVQGGLYPGLHQPEDANGALAKIRSMGYDAGSVGLAQPWKAISACPGFERDAGCRPATPPRPTHRHGLVFHPGSALAARGALLS